jgi:hypothetical protein
MPRALNLLRASPHYRRDAFDEGLRAVGFDVVESLQRPGAEDLLLIWNRYGGYAEHAGIFDRAGAKVLVAENCPLGNDFRGGSYSLAAAQVALTGGRFPVGDDARWDAWDVDLLPWRSGDETVILGQRGIGSPDARSPDQWAERVRSRVGGRIRQHPGTGPAKPLAEDLKNAGRVVTWSSAAAVQALVMGVPVWHAHPNFVGAGASRPLTEWNAPRTSDFDRLTMFRRLAWCIWTLDEIRSGEPIARLAA